MTDDKPAPMQRLERKYEKFSTPNDISEGHAFDQWKDTRKKGVTFQDFVKWRDRKQRLFERREDQLNRQPRPQWAFGHTN